MARYVVDPESILAPLEVRQEYTRAHTRLPLRAVYYSLLTYWLLFGGTRKPEKSNESHVGM